MHCRVYWVGVASAALLSGACDVAESPAPSHGNEAASAQEAGAGQYAYGDAGVTGLDEVDDRTATVAEDGTLAEITIPTEDGLADYRFRFFSEDDVLGVFVESPSGYPPPDLPDECILDTYLRVAPANAEVPQVMLDQCDGSPQRVSKSVSTLRTDAHTLALSSVNGEVCSKSAFDERKEALRKLAAYQPKKWVCESGDCETGYWWGRDWCQFLHPTGAVLKCNSTDHAHFLSTIGPVGQYCLKWGPRECDWVPNAACNHEEHIHADYYRWKPWTIQRNNVTRVRTQVSGCGDAKRTGHWRIWDGSKWSEKHPFSTGGDSYGQLILSAGWSNGKWRGRSFRVSVDQHEKLFPYNVISAWTHMKGLDKDTCPLKL